MGRHRILPKTKQEYDKEYWRKMRKPKEQAARQQEREEDSFLSPRFFDIQAFLRNTGEKNYCINLFLGTDLARFTNRSSAISLIRIVPVTVARSEFVGMKKRHSVDRFAHLRIKIFDFQTPVPVSPASDIDDRH